jgi:hypothetical protein
MLNITVHKAKKNQSNKMDGIQSLNTLPTTNEFCMKQRENKDTVCSACYCKKLEFYGGIKGSFGHNAKVLSESIIPESELPYINAGQFRFNSFGELINVTHYINLVNLAKKNKHCTFALWTKRVDIVHNARVRKPYNLILIKSSLLKDVQEKLPRGFNKVFTVFSKQYIEDNGIEINCGSKHCMSCNLCYTHNTLVYVNEKLK